jgi:hypothetical protein
VNDIKAWFDNTVETSNRNSLTSCNSDRKFQPRWDRVSDKDDRLEFDIYENGYTTLPKIVGGGLNLGRMKFVAKKKMDGENQQGMIVSFVPATSFDGNISNVSTKTFRKMKFSGLIIFNELNGCPSNAYKIEEGVVMNKLDVLQNGQLGVRCGEIITVSYGSYSTVTKDQSTGQCTFTIVSSKNSVSYGVPCFSSINDINFNYGGGGGIVDPIYVSYLAPPVVTRLCSSSIIAALTEPFWNPTWTTQAGNGYLPNNTVTSIGTVFEDLRLGGNSPVNMPYVEVEVTGISIFPMTPNVLATQITTAFSTARQNYFMNSPQGSNDAFAKEWMDAFNNSPSNRGRYHLQINPIGPQDAKPVRSVVLRDASDPNCK